MSSPFLAEIIMFGGNFAPRGWALCDGQLLAISQNAALFSILGTTYGGDGRVSFGLPELRGRVPMHQGNGPGLTPRQLGQKAGSEKVGLTVAELPVHNHGMNIKRGAGNKFNPSDKIIAGSAGNAIYSDEAPDGLIKGDAITNTGGNQTHDTMQPYLTVNFIIALQGIFPSRS